MQKKEKPVAIEYVESRPLLTADTHGPRIAFANPRPDRIDLANRMFLGVSQKRTGCRIIFGGFDIPGIFIPDETVDFHKIRQADIKIIRSRDRIQFRPRDSDFFTAVSASFAVEVRRRHHCGHYLSAFGVMGFYPFLGVKRERDDHSDS
jgi:hypothetical protein